MSKIVEYKIVSVNSVKKLMEDGWQPFGSPFVMGKIGVGVYLYQTAMVRYEETETPAHTTRTITKEQADTLRKSVTRGKKLLG